MGQPNLTWHRAPRQGLLAGSEYGYCGSGSGPSVAAGVLSAAAPTPAPAAALDLNNASVARRTTIDGSKCRLPVMFRCAPRAARRGRARVGVVTVQGQTSC